MAAELKDAVHAWLKAHDPKGPHTLRATLATSTERAAAAAVVAGPNAAKDVAASATLASTATTDAPHARDDFKNYPMDGCTSLLNMARVKANFNPSLGMTAANVTAYDDYIKRVVACPLFNIDMSDRQTIHRDSSDYDELINAVADTFDGVEADDKDKIKDSVKNLVNSAASNSGSDESTDLFVQSVIYSGTSATSLVYSIFIYSSHVHLVDNKSKGHHTMQEDFDVQRSKLTFRINDWPHFATAVWDKQWTSVSDWLDDNTTPTGTSTTLTTCIKPAT